jgi:hypothetical protein
MRNALVLKAVNLKGREFFDKLSNNQPLQEFPQKTWLMRF